MPAPELITPTNLLPIDPENYFWLESTVTYVYTTWGVWNQEKDINRLKSGMRLITMKTQ